jgi:molecular chaperone GrpE
MSDENEKIEEVQEDSKPVNSNEDKKEDGKTHEKNKELHRKKHEAEISVYKTKSQDELIEELTRLLNENEKLKKQLEEKEKESTDYLDRYRRSLADVENIRKRLSVEKQDLLKYRNYEILGDLLTVLDDFQRAVDAAKEGKIDFENYKTGIEMIEKQFADLLIRKYGVTRIGQKGEEFNPNLHSAMMMEEGDFEHEIILELFRQGYMLHDRVIRAAEVKIGKPKQS